MLGKMSQGEGVCVHKGIFPMYASEFYVYFSIIAILAFTNTGGLGGGGILIPIMMGIFHFDTHNAISISNCSTAVSSGVRYFVNLRESHPLKQGKGTIHDYGVAILMLPGIVIGATLGSIVTLSLPGPFICAGFILCNLVTSGIGMRNFFKIRQAENALSVKKMTDNPDKSEHSVINGKNSDKCKMDDQIDAAMKL